MKTTRSFIGCSTALLAASALSILATTLQAQPALDRERPEGPRFDGPPAGGGPGRGGPGMMQQETKLVAQFDKDGDKRLNAAERKVAREFLQQERAAGRLGRRGSGGPGGRGFPGRNENQEPPQPGAKVSPADVKSFPDAPLYDPKTLRTFFFEFENADWEKELSDFNNTDVEVPAKLTVDGKTYSDVGVHFRGASSFFTVGEGRKRSLNLAMDFAHENQKLSGYHTLNLLNSHEDPTFLRTVLYYQIAREYVPAPKANYVRVVINGENWGVYVNAQQFNKEFIKDWFDTTKGARWKVPGSPGGRGSLAYLGDDAAQYKRSYEIKTKDDPKAWAGLIKLCKVLNQTPPNKLEEALAPLLDIDGALKFLALENVLINNDGYWIRTSDYNIYQDTKGVFHVFPHDANETFARPGGPGFGRGPRGRGPQPDPDPGAAGPPQRAAGLQPADSRGPRGDGDAPRISGVELDPLINANDANKPLISKLLAVPSLRARYLGFARDIAARWLDWKTLGPIAQQHHSLIAAEVKADTRKLDSTEDFIKGITEDLQGRGGFGPGGGGRISLKNFADQRRAYLINYASTNKAAR